MSKIDGFNFKKPCGVKSLSLQIQIGLRLSSKSPMPSSPNTINHLDLKDLSSVLITQYSFSYGAKVK